MLASIPDHYSNYIMHCLYKYIVKILHVSLVVSVLDSPAVDLRSNPGSGSALLMSEKSQAVYYISSCHMLIDKANCVGAQLKDGSPVVTWIPG